MIADHGKQAFIIPWFLNEVARAPADGLHGELDRAPGGHHHDGQLVIDFGDAFQQRDPLVS